MFDKNKLQEILTEYKRDFTKHWQDEKYKWEAVKCFQDNWNINAADFSKMLESSITKEMKSGLSNFIYTTSLSFIEHFAKNEPETVRKMFIKLFDEDKDLYERIDNFQNVSSELFKKYPKGKFNGYMKGYAPVGANEISTYVWLRYPDKYYVYNTTRINDVSNALHSDYIFRNKDYANNFKSCYKLYDEICETIKKDVELITILKNHITNTCYTDPEFKTLTIDVVYYISQYQRNKKPSLPSSPSISNNTYTKENFLSEVYISEEKYNTLVSVLRRKKNIILQGAPGVGKTFAAKRLAYSMMNEKDDSRIEFVQFHQNYSYEDFVMGYKPFEDGFKLKHGIFYKFCQKASEYLDKDYFFIIDEINRGNMSKIFGELLMLIENNYRDTNITLAYDGNTFSVPHNLYIIGMMNTADRSLAMIDYALRRRFSFFDMEPAFDSEGFKKYQNDLKNEMFDKLINEIKELNQHIMNDKSLGKGFCIGHSYFCDCKNCTEDWLQSIVEYEILPMLSEYYFDNASELQRWQSILYGVFQ